MIAFVVKHFLWLEIKEKIRKPLTLPLKPIFLLRLPVPQRSFFAKITSAKL